MYPSLIRLFVGILAISSLMFALPVSADSYQAILDESALQQAVRKVVSNPVIQEATIDEAALAVLEFSAVSDMIETAEIQYGEGVVGSKVGNFYLQGHACSVVHSPDEKRIWAIHLYNFDESLTGYEVVFGLAKNRKIQSVACTPDGSSVLFSVKDGVASDYEIYAMDLSTKALTQLTDNDTDDVDVSLSADGLKMAWQERLTDGRQAIVLRTYQQSGGEFEQVSLASANPFLQPSLSANGQWLALIQRRENTYRALRYDTGTQVYLQTKVLYRNNNRRLTHPSVSNDGIMYGWLQGKNRPQYHVENLETGRQKVVLQSVEGVLHSTISPDGEWLSYSYDNEQSRGVKLRHISSGQTTELSDPLVISSRYIGSYWIGKAERAPVKLNDTGITQCADRTTNGLSCPISDYPDQDAQYGRDFNNNDDSDGHAGFSFTKLDANGNELLANVAVWSCVKDNVTGLIWEVKKGGDDNGGNEGLHDADDRYNWYSTDASNNSGYNGYRNDDRDICHGYDVVDASSYCNTAAFTARVNIQGLCGAHDWRLPTIDELGSLVNYQAKSPAIDTNFFPNTKSSYYWSSLTHADYEPDAWDYGSSAWMMDFSIGVDTANGKYNTGYVRLVRSGN